MDVEISRPGALVFVESPYGHNEMSSLRVNHRHRAVCRQTSKRGANGCVGILYKNKGSDSAAEDRRWDTAIRVITIRVWKD